MSEDSILASIFRVGDQVKRNLRDAYSDPLGYLEGAVIENHKNWKKKPDEMSMGFFNPVPLGTMGNFVLRKEIEDAVTNLSRRDFLKKSAGIAGGSAAASIPGSKLLQKFAPEERAVVKQAAVEAAPKYKYNTLKEYLDDVETKAYSAHDNPVDFHQLGDEFTSIPQQMREQLLRDEEAYKTSKFFYKDNLKGKAPGEWIDPFTGQPHSEEFLKNIRNTVDDFSPQAKKEMKAWKKMQGDEWTTKLSPNEIDKFEGWLYPQ